MATTDLHWLLLDAVARTGDRTLYTLPVSYRRGADPLRREERTACRALLEALAAEPDGGFLLLGVDDELEVVGLGRPLALVGAVRALAARLGLEGVSARYRQLPDGAIVWVDVPGQPRERAEDDDAPPEAAPSRKRRAARDDLVEEALRRISRPRAPEQERAAEPPPQRAPISVDDRTPLTHLLAYLADAAVLHRLTRQAPRNPHETAWDEEAPLVGLGVYAPGDWPRSPTVAGALVLGGNVAAALPGAVVVVDGPGRPERQVQGPLPALFAKVLRVSGLADPDGMIAELLCNAFLHRDWSRPFWRVPVRLRVLEGAVEVISPGEPLPESGPGRPVHRNPTLVDLARRLDWCRGEGIGLAGLQASGKGRLELCGLGGFTRVTWTPAPQRAEVQAPPAPVPARPDAPPPAVEAPVQPPVRPAARPARSPDVVRAALARIARAGVVQGAPASASPAPSARVPAAPLTEEPVFNASAVSPLLASPPAASGEDLPTLSPAPASPLPPPPSTESLPPRAAELCGFLARQGPSRRQEIEAALGCSRSTVRNLLDLLVARGRVLRSTPSARSPFQTYALADEGALSPTPGA